MRALLWGASVALYLRFGLEATAWFFYEASHALNIDSLYWGYTVFRGGGVAFGLWRYQSLACVGVGLLVGLLILWRSSAREAI